MLWEGWVLDKTRMPQQRFLKIRGGLIIRVVFHRKFSLRAPSAANCVWLLPWASVQGSSPLSDSALSTLLSYPAQPGPNMPESDLVSPRDIQWYIHSPLPPRVRVKLLSILSEAPRTVLHKYFQGIWDHQPWKKLLLASLLTLKPGLSGQALDEGRWLHSVNCDQSYSSPTPLLLSPHFCP